MNGFHVDFTDLLDILGGLEKQMTSESLKECQIVFRQVEDGLNSLMILSQNYCGCGEEVVQLIAQYKQIKDKIMGKFE